MFSVTVRDHMMIAHSLRGDVFGPAQGLHGATYVVDASFRRPELARVIADRLAERVRAGALGEGARELDALVVTLRESHVASAGYERPL